MGYTVHHYNQKKNALISEIHLKIVHRISLKYFFHSSVLKYILAKMRLDLSISIKEYYVIQPQGYFLKKSRKFQLL